MSAAKIINLVKSSFLYEYEIVTFLSVMIILWWIFYAVKNVSNDAKKDISNEDCVAEIIISFASFGVLIFFIIFSFLFIFFGDK